MVGNQMQPTKLLSLFPPEPPISRTTPKHSALPAGKSQPPALVLGNLTQTASDKAFETQAMVLIHQRIPASSLTALHQSNGHQLEVEFGVSEEPITTRE